MTNFLREICVTVLTLLVVPPALADEPQPRPRPSLQDPYTDPKQIRPCYLFDCSLDVHLPTAFDYDSPARDKAPSVATSPNRRVKRRAEPRHVKHVAIGMTTRAATPQRCLSPGAPDVVAFNPYRASRRTALVQVAILPGRRWFPRLVSSKSDHTPVAARPIRAGIALQQSKSTVAVRRNRRGGLEEGWIKLNVPG